MATLKRLMLRCLALAGSLTTFSTQIHPRDLPRYEHDNLAGCFTDLDDKIRILLETVVPTNFVSLPLKLVQPSIYATSLADDKYLHNTRLYLACQRRNARSGFDRKDALPDQALLRHSHRASGEARASRSAADTRHRPPSAIPVKLNYSTSA